MKCLKYKKHAIIPERCIWRHGKETCVWRPWMKADVWVTGIEPSKGMDSNSSVVMESLSRFTEWRRELTGRFRKSSSLSVKRSLRTMGWSKYTIMFRESEKDSWLNDDDDDDDTIITGRFRSECFWFSPKIKNKKMVAAEQGLHGGITVWFHRFTAMCESWRTHSKLDSHFTDSPFPSWAGNSQNQRITQFLPPSPVAAYSRCLTAGKAPPLPGLKVSAGQRRKTLFTIHIMFVSQR